MDLWFGIATFVGAFAIGIALQNRRGRSQEEFAAEEQTGLGHVARGDFESALQHFDAICAEQWISPSAQLIAGRHRAWALLRLGRIADAQLQLDELIGRTDDVVFNGHVRVLRALCEQCSAAPTGSELGMVGDPGSAPEGLLELAQAIAAIRSGRSEAAAELLQRTWRELEGRVTGDVFRLLRLVRAYAEHATATTREAGSLDHLLAPLRSAPPGFARLVTAQWPEMRLFCEAQSLP